MIKMKRNVLVLCFCWYFCFWSVQTIDDVNRRNDDRENKHFRIATFDDLSRLTKTNKYFQNNQGFDGIFYRNQANLAEPISVGRDFVPQPHRLASYVFEEKGMEPMENFPAPFSQSFNQNQKQPSLGPNLFEILKDSSRTKIPSISIDSFTLSDPNEKAHFSTSFLSPSSALISRLNYPLKASTIIDIDNDDDGDHNHNFAVAKNDADHLHGAEMERRVIRASKQHYCGENLIKVLALSCKGRYNKRSIQFETQNGDANDQEYSIRDEWFSSDKNRSKLNDFDSILIDRERFEHFHNAADDWQDLLDHLKASKKSHPLPSPPSSSTTSTKSTLAYWKGSSDSSDTIISRPPLKRGIVDECCKKPCSLKTLNQYCVSE
ncbi:acetylcholinesterase-like [Sarcoptes scabiei]|nr:acetylcholinesterase-like [Sarcoptes scabiei]